MKQPVLPADPTAPPPPVVPRGGSRTWTGAPPPVLPRPDAAGRVRAAVRGAALGGLCLLTFAALSVARLVDRPGGLRPRIVRWSCRQALRCLGIGFGTTGAPAPDGPHAVVANHASWLDILALGAFAPVTFVAKEEVRTWAGLGPMVAAAGTMFIRREARDARAQAERLRARLVAGERLLFFPEGTSTDGRRVLPFRTTLFEALRGGAEFVRPVTVAWHAPDGADPAFYGWWGGMDLGPHLLAVLSAPRQGRVEVIAHPALAVAGHPDRKALARAAERAVRSGLPGGKAGGAAPGPPEYFGHDEGAG